MTEIDKTSDQELVFRRMIRYVGLAAVALCVFTSAVAQQAPAPAVQSPDPVAHLQDSSGSAAVAVSSQVSPQEILDQQRKNQLAADTALLVKLANELKAEMDKSTKDELSIAVIKKADQVEKLAHKVRDEMKLTMGN